MIWEKATKLNAEILLGYIIKKFVQVVESCPLCSCGNRIKIAYSGNTMSSLNYLCTTQIVYITVMVGRLKYASILKSSLLVNTEHSMQAKHIPPYIFIFIYIFITYVLCYHFFKKLNIHIKIKKTLGRVSYNLVLQYKHWYFH